MTNLLPESIRKLLSDYCFEVDRNAKKDEILCIICKKIMTDAHETFCGCCYCHDCMVKYLFDGNKYCCGNKESCKDEILELNTNVTRNAKLNKNILKLKVTCPNELCTHSCLLTDMEEHMRVCTKQSTDCPYIALGGICGTLAKDSITTHFNDESLTHASLVIDSIFNLKNDCETIKSDVFLLKEYPNNYEQKMKLLDTESREKDVRLIQIEKGSMDINNKIDTIQHTSMDHKGRIESLEEELKEKNIEISDLKNTVTQSQTESSNMKIELDELKQQMIKLSEELKIIEELTKRLNSMDSRLKTLTNEKDSGGGISLTVENFNAKKSAKEVILSPHFYSHYRGYKLRLKVYLAGSDNKYTDHLSVGIVICKGEYDHMLSWPCQYTFNIKLMNQNNGSIFKIRSLAYNDDEGECGDSFKRPIDKDNDVFGYPNFISHKDLTVTSGLILNDSIQIICDPRAPT